MKCENCNNEADGVSTDGVPLCSRCGEALEDVAYRQNRAKTLARKIIEQDLITDDSKEYLRFNKGIKPTELKFYFDNKETVEYYIAKYE